MIKRQNLRFLKSFIKKQYKAIIFVSILELVMVFTSISVPYFLGRMITSLETNYATIESLIKNFIIVIGLYFIWDLSNTVIDIKFAEINKNIQNDIRSFCYNKILNSKISLIEDKSEGEIINKLLKDTEKLEQAFLNLFNLIVSTVQILALIIAMININAIATEILIVFFVILIIIQRIFSKKLEKGYYDYKDSEEELLKNLKKFISGFMNIKIFALESTCLNILNEKNKENFKNYKLVNKVSSIYSNVSFFIISVFRVLSLLIGGLIYLIWRSITLGEIFSMYSYAIQLTTELRSIIKIDIILKDVETSLDRIIKFINQFEVERPLKERNIIINTIESKNMKFDYKDNRIFNNLSFKLRKNDVVAIRGSNGSGKTSLMKLICGFYEVDNLFFNEIAQKDLSEYEILRRISYVPQNIYLFPDSILNNISCFGQAKEEEVYKVCKKLNIHNKILGLSDGYNTMVDEQNLNLSGGEKQIICIARALLKKSDILILDEINSALDDKMEENIIENIKYYYKNKIVLLISHKDRILEDCNITINLDDYK